VNLGTPSTWGTAPTGQAVIGTNSELFAGNTALTATGTSLNVNVTNPTTSVTITGVGTTTTGSPAATGLNVFLLGSPTVTALQGTSPWVVSGTVAVSGVSGTVSTNLAQVGGAAIALGQTTMSGSIPVTIASDQKSALFAGGQTSGATSPGYTVEVGGTYNSGGITMANGTSAAFQMTAAGLLMTSTTLTGTTFTTTGSPAVSALNVFVVGETNWGTAPATSFQVQDVNAACFQMGSWSLAANQSINVSQINGVTPLMGNGTTGTGSQRVTIASDNTAFSVNATVSNTATTPVYTTPASPTTSQYSHAAITFSGSGDNIIVALSGSTTIRVYRIFVVNGDASNSTNLIIKDSTPTNFTGAFYIASQGGSFAADGEGDPLWVAASGKNFSINSSVGVQISGEVWYTQS